MGCPFPRIDLLKAAVIAIGIVAAAAVNIENIGWKAKMVMSSARVITPLDDRCRPKSFIIAIPICQGR